MPVHFRNPRKQVNAKLVGTAGPSRSTPRAPRPTAMAPVPRGAPFPPRVVSRLNAKPLLSILIPTIPARDQKLRGLLSAIDIQISDRSEVELLVLRDSRGMTIGEKRNCMISIARGEYVTFVDDDDAVAGDYVSTIVEGLVAEHPDVLCYLVLVEGHGHKRLCRYDPKLRSANYQHEYHRKPNHLMVWRREVALKESFPPIQTGEDTLWADKMATHVTKVTLVDKILYTYRFDPRDNSAINVQK